ncbi:MAG: hypothetical protein HYT80_05370 [Euryarchaeota archaeon]|nr:hypothetical protein [Euryarchaeota archaeon]
MDPQALVKGLVGVYGVLVGLPTAAFAFLTGPGRGINRRLAAVLLFDALGIACYRLVWLAPNEASAHALIVIGAMAAQAIPFAYLMFIGRALETPLVRPFRGAVAQIILGYGAWAGAVAAFTRPDLFGGELRVLGPGWMMVPGPLNPPGVVAIGLVSLFGLFATASAWRRAPVGSVARQRAGWLLLAFGVRDVVIVLVAVAVAVFPVVLANQILLALFVVYISLVGPLLAFGILKFQLFDIALKFRFTLSRSTLLGIYGATFLSVEQLVQNLASAEFGLLAGAAAAGLLLFAVSPLNRFAERVGGAVLPHASSPAYLLQRRFEVYQAAVEAALPGGVSEKERRTLEALRRELDLTIEDAQKIESRTLALGLPALEDRSPGPTEPSTQTTL